MKVKNKREGKNKVKKLFVILYSIFFIVGCNGWNIFPEVEDYIYSECPDPMALNYNLKCEENENYDYSDCPWETNDGCEYCEDVYETEEERYEHCCTLRGAVNNAGQYTLEELDLWWEHAYYNNSQDSTYCIFE